MALLVLLSGGSHAASAEEAQQPENAASHGIPSGEGTIRQFLRCELPDGTHPLVPVTAEDMPWRVSITKPANPPKYGSRTEARDRAIAAMRQWEHAIQTELPWFQLEFVESDHEATVTIEWKRRMTGDAVGRGWTTCRMQDGRLRAGGRMEVSVRPCPTCGTLTLDEVTMLIAHEFGHVLGIGHCLDCDSAMNYSWQTRNRVFVTQTDVDAVVRRFVKMDSFATLELETIATGTEDAEPVDFIAVTCESLSLTRSCSDRRGARKRKSIDGLSIRFAGSEDGKILLVMPPDFGDLIDQGAATPASNERYSIVSDHLVGRGLHEIRAAPVVLHGSVVGYYVEFDGDAWSALGL